VDREGIKDALVPSPCPASPSQGLARSEPLPENPYRSDPASPGSPVPRVGEVQLKALVMLPWAVAQRVTRFIDPAANQRLSRFSSAAFGPPI
jgi:hypothetical protein